MVKRISVLVLVLVLALLAGCSKPKENEEVLSSSSELVSETSSTPEPEKELYYNPLTGVKDLANESAATQRPVAIMVNNMSNAQSVQTGVAKADIIYETEIEGGITRLLAVFQDVSSVECIGTVRSARYAFIDLAMGHNAVYIHHGQDPTYAKPHLKDVNHINIHENLYGKRLSNGLKHEHTLYTYGATLWEGISKTFSTQNKNSKPWQKFAAEGDTVTLSGGTANTVTVPFSGDYKTKFTYDATTGLYTRSFKDTVRTDYLTGEKTTVKNVIVVLTSITDYPDGEHREISLTSGDGYYVTNGEYTPIKWKKGSSSNSLKFTDTDGNELLMSAGKTWVCVASKKHANPKFE